MQDLAAIPDRLGAVSLEIPMREIGGQATPWDELAAIKAHCRQRNAHLHMDGARLWEAAAGYARPADEIARGFDSCYVSLYKGIGGLGGAMLAGSRSFIARAAESFRRQGGNVIHRSPYVVAAAMQFDQRLAAMPALFRRTEWLYDLLRDYPSIRPNPARPQANMLHLHLPVSRERALDIRDRIAREHKALAVRPRGQRRPARLQRDRTVRGRQPGRHGRRPGARRLRPAGRRTAPARLRYNHRQPNRVRRCANTST